VKVWGFEVPPPGAGLKTVMSNVPAAVRSLAGIAAVSCVPLTKVVVRFDPLNCTTEVDTKFVPFTVRVKSRSPTVLLVGEMLVVVGKGLFTVTASPDDQADSLLVCIAHLPFAVTVKVPPEDHDFDKLVVPTGSQPESPPSEKAKRIWTGSPMFEVALAVYVYGVLGTPEVGPVGVVTDICSILTVSADDQSETMEVSVTHRALALTE
jgi:hypothetical protein